MTTTFTPGTDETDEHAAHLLKASQSSNTVLAEAALTSLAKMFDPSEPRGPGGEWIAGGSSSGNSGKKPKKKPSDNSNKPAGQPAKTPPPPHPSIAATAPPKSGGGGGKGGKKSGGKGSHSAETAKIEAKLSALPKPKTPTPLERDEAVTDMQSKHGIPTGKTFASLPLARRQGAAQMASATRTLTGLNAQKSAAQAEVNAINNMAKSAKTAEAKKLLASKLKAAQSKLSGINSKVKAANAEFAEGLNAWQG